ncbi:MAG TPA: hypothetical protein VEJ84_22470 [Acidimicrobiales bacterium]|nr:hypothetical protein [Acidimicrobiales bacterium]
MAVPAGEAGVTARGDGPSRQATRAWRPAGAGVLARPVGEAGVAARGDGPSRQAMRAWRPAGPGAARAATQLK